MGYWTEDDLPFYHGLARTFPLADRWFWSCLGPTFPNRRFMIAGTAHGLIDDLPWDILDLPPAGTIFDMLTRHDIGWSNYHNVRPAKCCSSGRWARTACGPRAASPGSAAGSPRGHQAGPGQQAIHRRPVPARASRAASGICAHPAVLRRRGCGHAAGVQHRRPGLRGVLRGEPAGHPQGRELRRRGHQPGHARQGLAAHAADLGLRRARRLLRPRAAARGGAAGRRTGPQPLLAAAGWVQACSGRCWPRTCARSGPRTRARTATTGSGSGSRR